MVTRVRYHSGQCFGFFRWGLEFETLRCQNFLHLKILHLLWCTPFELKFLNWTSMMNHLGVRVFKLASITFFQLISLSVSIVLYCTQIFHNCSGSLPSMFLDCFHWVLNGRLNCFEVSIYCSFDAITPFLVQNFIKIGGSVSFLLLFSFSFFLILSIDVSVSIILPSIVGSAF